MLLGQDFGRRHQCSLVASADGQEHRQQRHHRLAGADITLHQAVHRMAPGQITADLLQHSKLSFGEPEGEGVQQSPISGVFAGNGETTDWGNVKMLA